MAKKVITGHLPPPVVVLVHADHDVHSRRSILKTVRRSSADTYRLYQLGTCRMSASFCKKVSAIRQYRLSISVQGLQHEVVDILRISLNLQLGVLQGGGYRWVNTLINISVSVWLFSLVSCLNN